MVVGDNPPPKSSSKATAWERQVSAAVTTDAVVFRVAFVLLLGGLVLLLLGLTHAVSSSWVGQSNVAGIVIYTLFLVVLVDSVGGRAMNSWLHGPSHAVCSATGMEVPVRREDAFYRCGEKYELRSPIFRRRLGGFTKPNWLEWSPLVILRFLPSHRANYRAMVVIDFRDLSRETRGLRSLFLGVRLWATAPQVTSLIFLVFKGGGHVHVTPKLVEGVNLPLRQCSLSHSMDLNLTGTCLAGLAEDEVERYLAGN